MISRKTRGRPHCTTESLFAGDSEDLEMCVEQLARVA